MIRVGETLYLERKDEEGEIERYKTVLVDINSQEFLIEVPINEKTKKFAMFQVGELFDCFVYMGGKVYIFKTTFIDRMKDKVSLLIMSYPGQNEMEVIQRRQHVRVNANLDVAVHPINEVWSPFRTMTLDISGGGCALILSNGVELSTHEQVQLWMVLPLDGEKYHYMSVRAELVRVFEQSGQKRASFRFVELTNGDRMQIIRYCFQREVHMKRK